MPGGTCTRTYDVAGSYNSRNYFGGRAAPDSRSACDECQSGHFQESDIAEDHRCKAVKQEKCRLTVAVCVMNALPGCINLNSARPLVSAVQHGFSAVSAKVLSAQNVYTVYAPGSLPICVRLVRGFQFMSRQ